MSQPYTPPFEQLLEAGAESTAREVLPPILDLVAPGSVVDVGCWLGTWLTVVRELGVGDVLGIDSPSTDRNRLRIPTDRFLPRDFTQPLAIERSFDLVLSLEVAEHLPATAGDDFVAFLTSLGPVVLFSAAIPNQGGEGHLNEQWPRYWVDRFAVHGFEVADVLRSRLWDNPRVTHWYAQNLLFFASREWFAGHSGVADLGADLGALPLVHPRTYQHVASSRAVTSPAQPGDGGSPPLRALLRGLPGATAEAVRSRLSRR